MTDATSPSGNAPFDERRLSDLTAALCDGLITPSDLEELQTILLANPTARERFLGDSCIHAGLEWDIAARGRLESLIDSCRATNADGSIERSTLTTKTEPQETAFKSLAKKFALWTVAATLLLTSAHFISQARQNRSGNRDESGVAQSGSSPTSAAEAAAPIASISPSTAGCRWMLENGNIATSTSSANRTEVRSGETLRVTSGTLQLTFDHGTVVSLAAPAILELTTSMRGRLVRGRATINVAAGCEGFTINTPRTSVVDLGTIFGVEVDDIGRTDVVVFSGIVDVTYSSDAQNATSTELGKQRLHTGEAMRVDERGTLSRIISLSSNHFADPRGGTPAPASRKPVISAVRDNIEREDAWNFYEIVPEGMGEDVKAFVDRVHHEWNGVDPKGMPSYLVGGDYVKTFNDDKNIGTSKVSVKLDEPANLYVLWCKRVPAPDWLRQEFQETGDEIGVDEGRHVFRDGTVHNRDGPGVGPGNSIDSIHTIWRRKVDKPSIVQLGPVEAPGWDFNMYGIVAVPLAKAPR